jgi:hypothetical protein
MSTRLAQAGAEINSVAEFPAESSADLGTVISAVISSTKAKTGTFSLRFQGSTFGRGFPLPTNPTQIKAGFFINHAGTGGSSVVFRITKVSGSNPIMCRWNSALTTGSTPTGTGGLLELVIENVVVATVNPAVISTTNQWYHIGVTWKQHATTGFCTVYIDGIAVLTFSGNTGSSAASAFYVGGSSASIGAWNASAYFDDIWVDDDSGGSDVAPASLQFMWSLATTAGSFAQFTPLASTNISNVDDVNSAAPDDDTTYNFASAASLKDTFNTADITVPAGYAIAAVIPVAWAKRSNAGVASQISLVAKDGSNTTVSSAKTPTTSYGPIWDRFTTDPSSVAWTQTTFNADEFGYQSAGTF